MLKALAASAAFFAAAPGFCSAAITSCTVSTTGLNFGTYDVFAMTPQTAIGTITYTCTGATSSPISIALNAGSRGSFSPRSMSSGPNSLTYNLYLDAGQSAVWGDGTGGTAMYSDASPALGTPVNVTMFGVISAGQNAHVGVYGDGITATVNF